MAKKLKNVELNSVDLCKRGANQYADIKLMKNFNEGGSEVAKKGLIGWVNSVFKKSQGENAPDDFLNVLKSMDTETEETKQPSDIVSEAKDGVLKSIDSIIDDATLNEDEKSEMLKKSIGEFGEFMEESSKNWVEKACKGKKVCKEDDMDEEDDDMEDDDMDEEDDMEEDDMSDEKNPNDRSKDDVKSPVADRTCKSEGEDNMDIEKMNMEELEKAEALIKARKERLCKSATAEESDEVRKAVADAQKELEEVKKSYQAQIDELKKTAEMNELKAIAKSYDMVEGETDKLADKLYMMKKAGDEVYKAYVETLDARKDLVEKSGLFKTIGSDVKGGSDDSYEKACTIAKSYMEKDPTLTREQAIDKAYMNNPELIPVK